MKDQSIAASMNFPIISLFENEDQLEKFGSKSKINLVKVFKNENDVYFSK